jgi:hypothetical protein
MNEKKVKKTTNIITKKYYKCKFCGEIFYNKALILTHLRKEHFTEMAEIKFKKLG